MKPWIEYEAYEWASGNTLETATLNGPTCNKQLQGLEAVHANPEELFREGKLNAAITTASIEKTDRGALPLTE